MKLIYIYLIIILGLSQILAITGSPLVTFDLQFSVPMVLVSKNDINSTVEDEPLYGDKILREITFPFNLGLNLGYIMLFNKQHLFVVNWNFKFSDDPINYLFDSSRSSKFIIPSYTSKNINNSFLFKYIWKDIFGIMEFSPLLNLSFNLSKNSSFDFTDNIYNFYSFTQTSDFKFYNLKKYNSALDGMQFILTISYTFYYFPNGNKDAIKGSDYNLYPATKKNFHNIYALFGYGYNYYQNISLYLKYKFSVDLYSMQPIHNGDLDYPAYSDLNEMTLKHYVNLDLLFVLMRNSSHKVWEFTLSYFFKYNDSNYVELLTFTSDEIEEVVDIFAGANSLGSDIYVYYQKNYKDYMLNQASIYSRIKFTPQHQITLGYSIIIKNFFEVYGKYGGDYPTFGAYINQKRQDLSHVISWGYNWKNKKKKISMNPFLGILLSESNNHTLQNNRHIYFIGIRGTYDL